MAGKSSFFVKQWGVKPTLFKYLDDALKQVPHLRNDSGRIIRARLRNFMTTIDFMRPLIDWKNQADYNELDVLLDIMLQQVATLERQLWIYRKKLELYLRIAREGKPDLLLDDGRKPLLFNDGGVISEEFPEGFVNAEA